MTSCREVRRLLARCLPPLEGERTLREEFEIEAHIEQCERCRASFERSEALAEGMLNLPLPPVERLDVARSLEAIHSAIAEDEGTASDRAPDSRVLRRVAGVAALLLVAVAAWLFAGRGEAPRTSPANVAQAPAPRAQDRSEPLTSASEDWMPRRAPQFDMVRSVASSSIDEPGSLSSDLDRTRLYTVRAQVRTALVSVDLDPLASSAEVGEIVRDIDRSLRELVASDWPVVRLVEGFARDSDPQVARVALRYVGFVGLRSSMPALRAELAGTDRGYEAVLALADAGDEGLEGLAEAVWSEPLRPLVIACLERPEWRGAQRFEWLEEALDQRPRRLAAEELDGVHRALLGVISLEGQRGAQALLARTRRRDVGEDLLLETLVVTRGAREAVLDEMLGGDAGVDETVLLECAERLEMTEALDWVSALAERGPFQTRALEVLAQLPGPAALETLVQLHRIHRPDEREFAANWRVALDRDPARARAVAYGARNRSSEWAQDYLELLVISELPAAVPAIVTLVQESPLARDDREWAMHSVLDLAEPEHADDVRELFARLGGDEARIGALCLMTLHAIGDPALENDVLAGLEPPRREQLLALLDTKSSRRVSAITLLRIGRELKPLLDWNPTEFWRRTQ